MGKIYFGQTDLTIKLQTDKNLSNSEAFIDFRKPNGDLGSFEAAIEDEALGIIKYIVNSTTAIDAVGKWTFWARIIDSNGLISIGEPFIKEISKPGN